MHNHITLTKFHHAAFTLEVAGRKIAFDFGNLSTIDEAKELGRADAVFVSHLHGDHLCAANLGSAAAPIYVPEDAASRLQSDAIPSRAIAAGEAVDIDALEMRVTAVPADHGPFVKTPCVNFGFLVEHGRRRIYYTGDVGAFTPPPDGFDALILPVGGAREQGFVFNPRLAADYIKQIGYRGLLIPCHYHGMSDPRTAVEFAELVAGLADIRVLGVGESLVLES